MVDGLITLGEATHRATIRLASHGLRIIPNEPEQGASGLKARLAVSSAGYEICGGFNAVTSHPAGQKRPWKCGAWRLAWSIHPNQR